MNFKIMTKMDNALTLTFEIETGQAHRVHRTLDNYEVDLRTSEIWDTSIGNCDFNLNTRFDGDRGDLLNNVSRAKEVDDSLVDTKFKSVPCVGTWNIK